MKIISILKIGFWSDREYYLDKMTLNELIVAFFQYYAIAAYLFFASILGIYVGFSLLYGMILAYQFFLSVLSTILIYPLVWYVLHRWVLHSQWMWKSRLTAQIWKRIHYDHHSDPNNLKVLFGALYTTLPSVAIATVPVGYFIAGLPGAATALCTGILTTCFYEFIHCIEHLGYMPKWLWLRELKKLHMSHHFHNEKGNFGITNFACDRLFRTIYTQNKQRPRSNNVFNLGYDKKNADKYPFVAMLTPDWNEIKNQKNQKTFCSEENDNEYARNS